MGKIEKTESVQQSVTVGYKCDVCGTTTDEKSLPVEWHYFSHMHHGWGNDSCDSVEYFYVCSPDCYIQQLRDSYEELKDERTGEISEMNQQFVKRLLDYIDGRTKE